MSSAIPCLTVQLLPGPYHESMHCFRTVIIVQSMLVSLLCLVTVGNNYLMCIFVGQPSICKRLDGILMLMHGYLTCKFITRPSGLSR